jgi:SAM-dependent methyltransferase
MDRIAAVARRAMLVSLLPLSLLLSLPVHAAQPAFEPRVGQAGKDVIWVPTPNSLVERMLRMANVGPDDRVIDLGSGDGRIPITAVRRFNATATGVEYNPAMVALSRRNAAEQGVEGRVTFVHGDIFATDLGEATVITMYLLPALNLRLRPALLNLKPGTRIVSHAFTMGDWRPDDRAAVEGQNAYLWIVPARVAGTWKLQLGAESVEVKLTQTFQDFRGAVGPANLPVQGSLKGDEIRFTLTDNRGEPREVVARIAGDQMSGKAGNDSLTGVRTSTTTP